MTDVLAKCESRIWLLRMSAEQFSGVGFAKSAYGSSACVAWYRIPCVATKRLWILGLYGRPQARYNRWLAQLRQGHEVLQQCGRGEIKRMQHSVEPGFTCPSRGHILQAGAPLERPTDRIIQYGSARYP